MTDVNNWLPGTVTYRGTIRSTVVNRFVDRGVVGVRPDQVEEAEAYGWTLLRMEDGVATMERDKP